MSLINILSNIGLAIGKVAQSLFTGTTCYVEKGYTYQLGKCRFSDIAFVRRSKGGVSDIYMCNVSPTKDYIVTNPECADEDDGIVILNHLEEHPITDWFRKAHDPRSDLHISLYKDEELESLKTKKAPSLNLSFNKLQLNSRPVALGGFNISITRNSGITGICVKCKYEVGLQNMNLCVLTSNKGVSLRSSDSISPQNLETNEETKFYPLDYEKSGFGEGDMVSGYVNLEISNCESLWENCIKSRKYLSEGVLNAVLSHNV